MPTPQQKRGRRSNCELQDFERYFWLQW
jgi:hypothetical protein